MVGFALSSSRAASSHSSRWLMGRPLLLMTFYLTFDFYTRLGGLAPAAVGSRRTHRLLITYVCINLTMNCPDDGCKHVYVCARVFLRGHASLMLNLSLYFTVFRQIVKNECSSCCQDALLPLHLWGLLARAACVDTAFSLTRSNGTLKACVWLSAI